MVPRVTSYNNSTVSCGLISHFCVFSKTFLPLSSYTTILASPDMSAKELFFAFSLIFAISAKNAFPVFPASRLNMTGAFRYSGIAIEPSILGIFPASFICNILKLSKYWSALPYSGWQTRLYILICFMLSVIPV